MKLLSLLSSSLLAGLAFGSDDGRDARGLQLELQTAWDIESAVYNTRGDILDVTFNNGGGIGDAVGKNFKFYYNPNGDNADSTLSCWSQGGAQLTNFVGLSDAYSADRNTLSLTITPDIPSNPQIFFPSPTEVEGPDGGFYTAAYLNLCVYFELQDNEIGVNFREMGIRITYFTENNFDMNIDTVIDINAGEVSQERRFTLTAEACDGAEEIGVGVPISVCVRTADYPFVQLTGIESLTFQAPSQPDGSQPTQVVVNNGNTVSSALTNMAGCDAPELVDGAVSTTQTCQVDSQLINALYAPGGNPQTISAFGKANVQYGNGRRRTVEIVLLRGSSLKNKSEEETTTRNLQSEEDSAFEMRFNAVGTAAVDDSSAATGAATPAYSMTTLVMIALVAILALLFAYFVHQKMSKASTEEITSIMPTTQQQQ